MPEFRFLTASHLALTTVVINQVFGDRQSLFGQRGEVRCCWPYGSVVDAADGEREGRGQSAERKAASQPGSIVGEVWMLLEAGLAPQAMLFCRT